MPLDVTEYSQMADDGYGRLLPTGREPGHQQQIAIGGASAQSVAFGGATRFVRLHTDAACRIKFGSNPTADGTSARMAAGSTEFFGVRPGDKVAVISTT